ncbi:MAG: winged helix-turn-helix domain-containing protein [Jiangellaceae bacterium]
MVTVAVPTHVPLFVGREAELRTLTELIDSDEARVAFLHGIAGMGKTVLLRSFAGRAIESGASVLWLDCRTVEPTERGLLAAVGGFDDVDGFVRHLAGLSAPVLVAFDHYELFRLMDTWLRQVLVPALPATVRVVLAGREKPVAAWFSVEGFRTLPLGALDDTDALALLRDRGASPADAVRLNRIARGHPLALTLASAGVAEHPELGLQDAAITRVVGELARIYLQEINDVLTRRALEAASVVRRATGPLLSAMLEDTDGDDALSRLLELPFVDTGRYGLVVHEAVKDAVADFVRGANPLRYASYRRAAWRELRAEAQEAAPRELWRYTADMLYLIDNPVVREAFFPSGTQPLAVEPARPDDLGVVQSISRRHDGADAAAVLEHWWATAPETFSVVRDRDGEVAGFFSLLQGHMERRSYVADDPIIETWASHLREHPLPKGQIALGLRRWLDAERGELPCASQAACWLDVKRTYMALRPALRRMYVVVRDVPTYWPIVEKLGFRPLPDPVSQLGGADYTSVCLDFGPKSVDGWLSTLVDAELGIGDGGELDEQARELSMHGQRVPLTPLEFGLFRHLRDREGKTVSRPELLDEVWGTKFTGGSNVVDAVVRSLRHKLGPDAKVLETVRSSGYRLRSDWRSRLS